MLNWIQANLTYMILNHNKLYKIISKKFKSWIKLIDKCSIPKCAENPPCNVSPLEYISGWKCIEGCMKTRISNYIMTNLKGQCTKH